MEQEQYETIRRDLEAMAQQNLRHQADLSRLLERMDTRMMASDNILRDVRLTMTGIGSLAKSLAERQDAHEVIMKSLAATLAKQDTINERLTGAIERLDVTLQAIKDLLGRGNGH
jgi:ABC-type transporter Mla subunit MlaD